MRATAWVALQEPRVADGPTSCAASAAFVRRGRPSRCRIAAASGVELYLCATRGVILPRDGMHFNDLPVLMGHRRCIEIDLIPSREIRSCRPVVVNASSYGCQVVEVRLVCKRRPGVRREYLVGRWGPTYYIGGGAGELAGREGDWTGRRHRSGEQEQRENATCHPDEWTHHGFSKQRVNRGGRTNNSTTCFASRGPRRLWPI